MPDNSQPNQPHVYLTEDDLKNFPVKIKKIQPGNTFIIPDSQFIFTLHYLLKMGIVRWPDNYDSELIYGELLKLSNPFNNLIEMMEVNTQILPSFDEIECNFDSISDYFDEVNEYIDLLEPGISQNVEVIHIGDDLNDRMGVDYLQLKLFKKLSDMNVNIHVIFSNHTLEFYEFYLYFKSNPSILNDEIKSPFVSSFEVFHGELKEDVIKTRLSLLNTCYLFDLLRDQSNQSFQEIYDDFTQLIQKHTSILRLVEFRSMQDNNCLVKISHAPGLASYPKFEGLSIQEHSCNFNNENYASFNKFFRENLFNLIENNHNHSILHNFVWSREQKQIKNCIQVYGHMGVFQKLESGDGAIITLDGYGSKLDKSAINPFFIGRLPYTYSNENRMSVFPGTIFSPEQPNEGRNHPNQNGKRKIDFDGEGGEDEEPKIKR